MRKLVLISALVLVMRAHSTGDQFAQANAALQAGEADEALAMLTTVPQTAETHNLRCRVLFSLEHWDAAVTDCQEAVEMEPANSNDHMWLARALGERADRASFVSAFGLAKRTRSEFETAVHLDPRNAEALADLGEFYYSAPGVVGGGDDKAESIAEELDRVDPARAHELRARMGEKNQDFMTAEREFKAAIAVSPRPAFQWVMLAGFYRRRGRWSEFGSAMQMGHRLALRDRHSSVALFNAATILSRANHDPALAAKMLEEYLASNAMTEEGPAFLAHTRLARLKAQLGDKAGAEEEREDALALAHDYKPAQDLKF